MKYRPSFLVVFLKCSDLHLKSRGDLPHDLPACDFAFVVHEAVFVEGFHLLGQGEAHSVQPDPRRCGNQDMGRKMPLSGFGGQRDYRHNGRMGICLIVADHHGGTNPALLMAEFVKYIEVKSTKRLTCPDIHDSLWVDTLNITRNEYVAAQQHKEFYSIFRVYFTRDGVVFFVLANVAQKFSDGKIQAVPMTYRVDFSNSCVDNVIRIQQTQVVKNV